LSERPSDFWLGDWLVQPSLNRASRGDQTVHLRAKVTDVLVYLAGQAGQVVSKEDLFAHVWKGEFVSDSALTRVVTELRQVLGDEVTRPRLLETIPKRGYRLIAEVRPAPATVAALRIEEASRPTVRTPTKATAVVLSMAVLLGVVVWGMLQGRQVATIAVLPFENLGSDPERQYIADGLTEETTAALGHVDPARLSVIGRTSTLAYKGTTKSLVDIGRELNSDYLLESSIRGEGDHLRITSKLVRARDQVQIWSSSYDRQTTSILGLERELSAAIARAIRVRLVPARFDALAHRHTQNVEAYDLYLKGRYYWMQFTPATNAVALSYYERALSLDPNYALAWSGVADTVMGSTINSAVAPGAVSRRAHEAAANAVRAGPELAEAHSSVGHVAFFPDWDWAAAEAAFRKALSLDDSYTVAGRMLGHVLSQRGRHSEASAVMRRVRELDPLQPMHHAISAQVAYQARDPAAAVEHARRAIALNPTFWIGYAQQALALHAIGQSELALEALAKASQFSGNHVLLIGNRGHILSALERLDEARATIDTLNSIKATRYVPPMAIATVYAGLGDREKSFEWLERAYEVRDVNLIFLPVDPRWDPYRADPRFSSLLERAGFR
jgi:TolB-like protein/DNA-binding winged helix-turn-helix (wHTH) protein/Flp pilus assembly protein TadD